ncbi:hypothetical protein ACFQT0_20710 [Hymenobacter humi]|uniref:Gylcosyl hydrolase 115 C-terminal domain-containing protein n=1 Tax=Hymenobacter humi TaxID=1411620 RepID=A0ABW2U897_9BACT
MGHGGGRLQPGSWLGPRPSTRKYQPPAATPTTLVLHPVQACANLNELYYTVVLNREAAKKVSPTPTSLAEKAKALFAKDAEISRRYHAVAGGKWNHMMDQTHIGYTNWQQPPVDKMPEVMTLPAGTTAAPAAAATPATAETAAYVSLEAEQYTQAVNAGPITWQRLPDLGRTAGAVTTFPVTAAPTAAPGGSSPHLQYRITLDKAGPVTVSAYLAPTLDFTNTTGLRYAVSIDDEALTREPAHRPGSGKWQPALAAGSSREHYSENLAAQRGHCRRARA